MYTQADICRDKLMHHSNNRISSWDMVGTTSAFDNFKMPCANPNATLITCSKLCVTDIRRDNDLAKHCLKELQPQPRSVPPATDQFDFINTFDKASNEPICEDIFRMWSMSSSPWLTWAARTTDLIAEFPEVNVTVDANDEPDSDSSSVDTIPALESHHVFSSSWLLAHR